MHKQFTFVCLVLLLTTLACGSPSAQSTSGLPETPFVLPTPEEIIPTPTLPPPPSELPPLSIWPLPADLFYLTDAGQVWRQPYAGDETTAVAVTRPEEKVLDFSIAPGGEWVLYRTDAGVAVRSLDGSRSQVIAQGVGAPPDVTRGRTLSWSPDASRVAYVTATGFQVYIPGVSENLQPMIFDAHLPDSPIVDLGWSGDARWLIVRRADVFTSLCDTGDLSSLHCIDLGRLNGYAWLVDDRLAFAPAEGGLAILDPTDLDSRAFMVPQERQVDLLFQRPDDQLAFFIHDDGIDQPGFLHLGDPADGGFNQEGSIPLHTAGLSWDVAGARLITRGQNQAVLLYDPIAGGEGELKTNGLPVSVDWGDTPPRGVTSLPLAGDLYFLASQAGIVQVWRLPAVGDQPETITNASTDVLAYDVAPGGTQVAYTSDGTLYVGPIDTGEVKDVAVIAPDANSPTGTPAFSFRGDSLAYANNGIWVVDVASGQKRRLVSDVTPANASDQRQVFDQPRWSPDGRWLLVKANFFQGYDYALLSSAGPSVPIFLEQYNARAEWNADNTILVYSDGSAFSRPGLFLIMPAKASVVTPLLNLPILDVASRPDGRLAFLRAPGPFALGPTSVMVLSAQPDGTNVQAETGSLVMEQPILSPDAIMVAGLVQTRRDAVGHILGSLVVINPATGQVFVLEEMPDIYSLRWSR